MPDKNYLQLSITDIDTKTLCPNALQYAPTQPPTVALLFVPHNNWP